MKGYRFRWMSLALALTLVLSVLAGCSSKPTTSTGGTTTGGSTTPSKKESLYTGTGETVLQYWNIFTGPDGKGMQLMVDKFNEEFKGKIKIEMQVMPGGEYYEKIVTAVASGKAPDVGIMHLDNVAKFASKNVIAPMDDRVAQLGLEEGDFSPSVWRAGTYQGKRYAVPLDVHPLVLYYNKDLLKAAGFENPPANWDEFVKMAKAGTKDTNGDGKPDQWGYMLPKGWPHGLVFWAALHQNGASVYDASGSSVVFNSEAAVKAMQQLVNLVEVEKVSPANVAVDGGFNAFKQGKALFHLDGIWMLDGMKGQTGLNFDVAPTHTLFGSKPAAWAGSHQFVVFNQKEQNKDKLDAAFTFINWITKNSVTWASYGQIPARKSARESAEFKALAHQSKLAVMVDHIVFMASTPTAPDGWGPAWEAFDLALDKKLTVQKALDEAVVKGNKALKGQ